MSQFDISGKYSKFENPENRQSISETFEISHYDKSGNFSKVKQL